MYRIGYIEYKHPEAQTFRLGQGSQSPCSSAAHPGVMFYPPVLLLSKLNKMFFGYFDPVNILLDNENTYFSG